MHIKCIDMYMYELALRCLEADLEIFNPMSVKYNVYNNVKMLVMCFEPYQREAVLFK